MVIEFCKLNEDAILPEQEPGSEGFDLYLSEDVYLEPGKQGLFGTGIVCRMPKGYYSHIYLRSSSPRKFPGLTLANGTGVIDWTYCGPNDELKLFFRNNSNSDKIEIKKGTKIAQLVAFKSCSLESCEVSLEDLKEESRGGFGSTDK